MVFAEESTTAGFLLRARREGIRDFGACMAPFTAFQILQGIETLPLRMARHVDNTRQIVVVPRRASDGRRGRLSRASKAIRITRSRQRLLPRGCGAVFSFNLEGHARAGPHVHRGAEALLASRQRRRRQVARDPSGVARRISGCRPRISPRPASPKGTIRLSVGLEHADDLIEDLSRALHAAGKA